MSSRKITQAAMAAAVIFLVTWTVKLPIPGGGYINLGDTVIYLSAFLFGGPAAAAAAALGSALADVAAGYVIYAPATFVIKGIMGLAAGLLCAGRRFPSYLLACILGGAIMTGGYALYELAVFGGAYALANIPYNLIQWGGSAAIAAALYPAANRIDRSLRKNEGEL
jgi:uncharacterized membrane protein